MANNKHAAVWEWLQTCPYIKDLFFNFSQSDPGDTALVPSESIVETYLDGSSLRLYSCALTSVIRCTFEPNDTANIDAASEFERIIDWLREQCDSGNFPPFPTGETPQDIILLPNESGFFAAQDMSAAKYMLQFQIEYLKG